MLLRGSYPFPFGLYFFHLITMCVEQQLAIIVTGRGKTDNEGDCPLASGSGIQTHPRCAISRSYSPLEAAQGCMGSEAEDIHPDTMTRETTGGTLVTTS